MNTNFKVVFNKARGALMVANEITSSVQAKGTKTVVAAAVAAVMAGVAGTAMAANNGESVEITGTLVAQPADPSGTEYKADGVTVVVDPTTDNYAWGSKEGITNTLGTDSVVTLKNGTLQAVNVAQDVNAVKGYGTIDIQATTGAASITETTGSDEARTFDKLDVNFTVHNSKEDNKGLNATLTLSGAGTTTFSEGTMKVVADEKSDGDKALGVATLTSTGALQFGVASDKATGGTVTDHGKAYNFDVKAKAKC
ncbi:ESPR-type extended signal peptide-containing protein [uncultured Sutterella sp.]|uniref:ESPR-type extended signal peptide-containing protein n=1 Tax=uncultured Sutterella sp. TaxID=286133 RepID=UPI00260EAD6A|nr:ESPR-type extended signal peptide-containing protein [uncultured Sutterella sp.]